MSPLVLFLMTSCPVAAGPTQFPEAQPAYSRDGNQAASESGSGGHQSLFSRIRSWFHRSPQGNDNQAPGDWRGNSAGYPQVPVSGPAPSYFPAGNMPAPVRLPTTAEPPLAVPGPPGR
jgi:hypothetical protein